MSANGVGSEERELLHEMESLVVLVVNNSQIFGPGIEESETEEQNATSIEELYISDETLQIFYIVNLVIISTGISLFGIVANIINIIIFNRLGFQETVNITLCALAVSDLAALFTLLWGGICVNPFFQYADTPLLTVEIQDITGGWPHVLFCRITGWLTAFVTVERSFCVIFPLKVKRILTPRRVKVIIVFIFLLVTSGMAPIFYSTNLGWKFVPERNRTMLGLVYTDNWFELMEVSVLISGVVSTLSFSTLIVVATVVLVITLNKKAKWRQQTVSVVSEKEKQRTITRHQRIIKMVVIIAAIFLICLFPPSLLSVPLAVDPEFSFSGKYGILLMGIVSFCKILEAINASINIFVYYNMSSNYRLTFRSIFLKGDKGP